MEKAVFFTPYNFILAWKVLVLFLKIIFFHLMHIRYGKRMLIHACLTPVMELEGCWCGHGPGHTWDLTGHPGYQSPKFNSLLEVWCWCGQWGLSDSIVSYTTSQLLTDLAAITIVEYQLIDDSWESSVFVRLS